MYISPINQREKTKIHVEFNCSRNEEHLCWTYLVWNSILRINEIFFRGFLFTAATSRVDGTLAAPGYLHTSVTLFSDAFTTTDSISPIFDIISESLFWQSLQLMSAERTTSCNRGMDKDSAEARLVPGESDRDFMTSIPNPAGSSWLSHDEGQHHRRP